MTLFIHADLWQAATGSLHARPHDRERVAFLDGPVPAEGGPAVATTLVLPELQNSWGNYRISPDAMSRAGGHLRHLGMLRLAQIHSHPSAWTGHSDHDDEFAFSHRDGAISIVVPHYGSCSPGLHDCGVHVCLDGAWHEIPRNSIDDVVRMLPSILDFRP
jgi:hypothetical protein